MRHVYGALPFMLRWAALFLIIAIIAAAFGFDGVPSSVASIAQVLSFIFLLLFLGCLVLESFLVKRK